MKFLYTIFAFLFLSSYATAQETTSTFAVVDYQGVIQESKAFANFQAQITENRTALETQFQQESDELRATEQELINTRADFSEEEFEEKRVAFEKQVEEFQTKFQTKQAEFEQNNADVLQTIEDELSKTISSIASSNGYSLVYRAASFVFYDETKDISEAVLAALDEALPTVTLQKVS